MQIPYTPLLPAEQVPNESSTAQPSDYHGPRTTVATFVLRNHIRSFYQLFAAIGIFLIISIFHSLCVIVGYSRRKSCVGEYKNLPIMIMIVGSMDLTICLILIFITIGQVIWGYQRNYLLCVCSAWLLLAPSVIVIPMAIAITGGQWMTVLYNFNTLYGGVNSTCDNSIRYVIIIMWIYRVLTIVGPMLYKYITK